MIRSLNCLRNPKNPNYVADTSTINSHNRTTIIQISAVSGLTNAPLVTYAFSTITNNDNESSTNNTNDSGINTDTTLNNDLNTNTDTTLNNDLNKNTDTPLNNDLNTNNDTILNDLNSNKNTTLNNGLNSHPNLSRKNIDNRCASPIQIANKRRLDKKKYNRQRAENITTLYEQQVNF